MKPRLWTAIVVFLSAYSPLPLIFYIQNICWDTYLPKESAIVFSLLGVSAVSVLLLWFSILTVKSGGATVTVFKVKNRSTDLVNYSIPYMISFFVMDIGDLRLLLSFGLFMFLMFILTYRTHNIFINPILAIFGYNLYNVVYLVGEEEREELILVRNHKPVKGDKLRRAEISDYLYLAADINPEV